MKKTSLTDPLQIAAIPLEGGFGRLGITLCPGKYDPHGGSGCWDRDLSLDLEAIRNWGGAAVVTLLIPQELADLRVERLGHEVVLRGMSWFHLPITDGSIPDEEFERQWASVGKELRDMLRDGRDIVVHCRGGLGRAGTIGARLLIELGMAPETAIKRVRGVRPGAIQTRDQEDYVLGVSTPT